MHEDQGPVAPVLDVERTVFFDFAAPSKQIRCLILDSTSAGERFDRAIHARLEAEGAQASVREVRRGLREGEILINGRKRSPGDRAVGTETVDLSKFVLRAESELVPDQELLARSPILFEDKTLLALSKPSGVNTAPLRALETGTLLGAAVAHAPEIASAGPPLEGGLLHRLDYETSGVVLFAKDPVTREHMRAAFAGGKVEKRYDAIVGLEGAKKKTVLEDAVIDSWIVQSGERVRICLPDEKGAMPAHTDIKVLAQFVSFAHVEALARSGRRHQIRVHLASLGAPIAGDPLYDELQRALPEPLTRLALHARSVRLPDGLTITAPLAPDLVRVLQVLTREAALADG